MVLVLVLLLLVVGGGCRQPNRQAGRRAGRQAGKQAGRQAGKQASKTTEDHLTGQIPRLPRGRARAPHVKHDATTPAFPLREPFGARHPPTPVNGDEDARHRSKTGLQTSESTLPHLERQACKPRQARCHTLQARRANLGKDVAKPREPGVQTSKTIWTNPRRCFDKPKMSYSFSWKNSCQT